MMTTWLAATVLPGLLIGPAAPASAEPEVTGFALGSVRPAVLERDAAALTTLTIAGVAITPDGRDVEAPSEAVRSTSRLARANALRTELILNNWSNTLESFDHVALHRLLSDRDAISRVAEVVRDRVVDGDWDGVNVDMEGVRAADADGLVALVDALQAALPAERTVSIDISAATSTKAYAGRGYDVEALGASADVVVVMTYDQHGATFSEPGPVGDLRWQRECAQALLATVPADKIDLGVPGYGYTWPARGTGRTVTVAAARRLVARDGARAIWHPRSGEWSATLSNTTVLWWSDGRSYRRRIALARALKLHGVAIWRLGSADPL